MLAKKLTIPLFACLFACFTNCLALDARQPVLPSPVSSGPPILQIEYKSPVLHLAWSPDGKQFASRTKEGTIHITDAATGRDICSFAAESPAGTIAFAPEGNTLAVVDVEGGFVGLWNTASGKLERKLGRAAAIVVPEHVAFMADGQTLMGIGLGAVFHWSLAGGCGVGVEVGRPSIAAIAPDGSVGGWWAANGYCRLQQVTPQNQSTKSTGLQVGRAYSIAFGPGAKLLAIGCGDNGVQLWDLVEKKETVKLSGLQKPATQAVFSADAKRLAAVAGDGPTILVWDLPRNIVRCQINHKPDTIGLIALAPKGKTLATTSKDGKVLYIWPVAAREWSSKGSPAELSAEKLASLWTDLADTDFEKADAAWRNLGVAGDRAVEYLRKQISTIAVPPADIQRIDKLVSELESEKFATRDLAIRELTAFGEVAISPLERLLEKPPSVEAREGAKVVLKKIGEPVLTPDRQRVLDSIELLEQMRTAKAIALLEEIERDALIPQIRQEAKRALQRIWR